MLAKIDRIGAIAATIFLVLAVHTYQVSGIECYECTSESDPRCGDPFDPYSLGQINCSLKRPLDHLPDLEPTLCRKTIQKVYGKVRVIRECGYITDADRDDQACVRRSGTSNVFATYCSCTGDLCNSASSQLPSVFVTASILAVGIVRYRAILNL